MAAALTAALSTPALAQTTSDETHTGWVASVLFGTNFQASTDRENLGILDIAGDTDSQGAASFAFSGQIAYLWENVGIEGLFDFTPSVDVTRAEFSEPSANSYMANLITAIPIGPEGRFQPYMSGGIGAVSLSTDLQDIFFPGIVQAVNFEGASQTKFGWNLGAGASAFGAGPFGFRADIRYFRAASSSNVDNVLTDDILFDALDGILETSNTDRLTRGLLSGLSYWRANVGLALRW